MNTESVTVNLFSHTTCGLPGQKQEERDLALPRACVHALSNYHRPHTAATKPSWEKVPHQLISYPAAPPSSVPAFTAQHPLRHGASRRRLQPVASSGRGLP